VNDLGACPRCGLAAGSLTLCPRCLLADDPGLEPPAPQAPPGLVLEEEIGRGGMGRVFRARHLGLDRLVAVKFLPPELAGDQDFAARFAREARALGRLAHPHVVAVHDSGTTGTGEPYLVMEYLPGGTLASRLPLPAADALRVAIEVCEGLGYAHAKGLVHRDIKPENVLFDEHGQAKVADFGIARLAEPAGGGDTLTRPSLVLGTPAYMAPEGRAGGPPDPRLDVFAVGVLLAQMITGRPPGTYEGLPPAVAGAVRRATDPDPRHRPADAAALREVLAALAPGARDQRQDAPEDQLPPDELSWVRAVALVLAGATAIALYAFLVSVTPRVHPPGDTLPFVILGSETLPDGRVATRARFETWPTLAAAAAFAVALAAYGLLRRHWRHSGLEVSRPDRPLRGTAAVVKVCLLITALFLTRLLLLGLRVDPVGAHYVPVVGGTLELAMVYFTWMAVLEAQRTGRSLGREPLLWMAVTVSLVPPIVSFGRILMGLGPI
jgi:eukaryotic-like serine/threonine-protein kinase